LISAAKLSAMLNLPVIIEDVIHEKAFQILVVKLLMVAVIRGVDCGGDSASGRTVREGI
jgi:hypothetical protein